MPVFVLPLIFVLAEFLSLIVMVDSVGLIATILLWMVMIFIGGLMLRHIGFSAAILAIGAATHGTRGLTWYQMFFPVRYIVAAFCFISPGFVSDVLGLLLLLPLPFFGRGVDVRRSDNPDIIEGEFREVDPQAPRSAGDLPYRARQD